MLVACVEQQQRDSAKQEAQGGHSRHGSERRKNLEYGAGMNLPCDQNDGPERTNSNTRRRNSQIESILPQRAHTSTLPVRPSRYRWPSALWRMFVRSGPLRMRVQSPLTIEMPR